MPSIVARNTASGWLTPAAVSSRSRSAPPVAAAAGSTRLSPTTVTSMRRSVPNRGRRARPRSETVSPEKQASEAVSRTSAPSITAGAISATPVTALRTSGHSAGRA